MFCVQLFILFFHRNIWYFIYTKNYLFHMITFSYRRFIDYILISLSSGSIFFLLLLSPLLYYSFTPSFYTENMIQQGVTSSDVSFGYVQNIYMFIQGKSFLDPHFSVSEKSHMEDVKKLFGLTYFIEIFAAFVFLSVLFIFIFQRKVHLVIKSLFRGSLLSLLLFFLLVLLLFIDFEVIFSFFHTLFFPQGNRSFDVWSMLISLFPSNFFEAITIRIFSVGAGISLLIFVFCSFVILYSNKKHS